MKEFSKGEGAKKLMSLTKSERAGWTVFEAAAKVMTKALAEEKGPSKSANWS